MSHDKNTTQSFFFFIIKGETHLKFLYFIIIPLLEEVDNMCEHIF